MVIKNLENKIKLVGIICTAFLVGCVVISVSSIWTARTMVTDAQKKSVCAGRQRAHPRQPHHDGRNPLMWRPRVMWKCSTTTSLPCRRMTSISAIRWKRRCIWWTKPDWRSTTRSKSADSTPTYWERAPCSPSSATASGSTRVRWSSRTTDDSASSGAATS